MLVGCTDEDLMIAKYILACRYSSKEQKRMKTWDLKLQLVACIVQNVWDFVPAKAAVSSLIDKT